MTDSNSDDSGTDSLGPDGAYSEAISKATTTKAEESQQLQDRQFSDARGGAISPPYPPSKLAKLIEVNTTHAKSGFSKARNVAGYGLELVPHPEVDDPSDQERDVAEEFWFSGDSTWQVGPMESELATPADVLEMAWADYEFIGWFGLEALVSTDGTPTGLAYVPAPTIRKREDAPGFVQVLNGDLQYFGSFGDRYGGSRVFVDGDSGAHGRSVEGTVANELIYKRNHTPFVEHYGTPDIIPAIPNIEGDQEARAFNIDFFNGNGVPRLGIIVEGGELSEESRESIRKLFHKKLQEENHRTAILEVEKLLETQYNFDDDQNVSVRLEPLTVGMEEDASFLEYHSYNEHEILKAHDVPPVEAGTVESGAFSTDAEQQRKQYIETVIKPKQESLAELLYETIHSALGVSDWTIQLKNRGVDTRLSDAQIAKERITASQGMMTVNEARGELGLEPLDGPVGEMLIAEVGGMGGAGRLEELVDSTVSDAVDDARDDLRSDLVTEGRIMGGGQ